MIRICHFMIIVPNEPLFPVQIKNRCQTNTSLIVLGQSIPEVKDMVESESSFSFLLPMSKAQLCSPTLQLHLKCTTLQLCIFTSFYSSSLLCFENIDFQWLRHRFIILKHMSDSNFRTCLSSALVLVSSATLMSFTRWHCSSMTAATSSKSRGVIAVLERAIVGVSWLYV